MAASPVRLSSNPDEAAQPDLADLPPPPDLGADTDKILAEAGLDKLIGEDLSGGMK